MLGILKQHLGQPSKLCSGCVQTARAFWDERPLTKHRYEHWNLSSWGRWKIRTEQPGMPGSCRSTQCNSWAAKGHWDNCQQSIRPLQMIRRKEEVLGNWCLWLVTSIWRGETAVKKCFRGMSLLQKHSESSWWRIKTVENGRRTGRRKEVRRKMGCEIQERDG